MRVAVILLAALIGAAKPVNPEDVRLRSPSRYDFPGNFSGNYAAEEAINLLPDVITSTVELLTPVRQTESLVPRRTVEKR